MDECKSPKACTILLRGPSKDILNEIDRNLADAMSVARNVVFNPQLAPGGGATEMAISVELAKKAKAMEGVAGAPYRAVADALEVIPRTLIQNCGGNAIRVLTELRVRPEFILLDFLSADPSNCLFTGKTRQRRASIRSGR
jgi:T-complex protein 1 subunit gamma